MTTKQSKESSREGKLFYTCIDCKEKKSVHLFYKRTYLYKGERVGYYPRCKKCKLSMDFIWRNEHKDYKKKHYQKNKQQIKEYHYALPKLEMSARAKAYRRKSRLIKGACEKCGATKSLQMHHPDYNKPLEVVTLCPSCHKRLHMGLIVL